MASVFHSGELAVQTQLGVQAAASRLGKGIHASVQPAMQAFLRSLGKPR